MSAQGVPSTIPNSNAQVLLPLGNFTPTWYQYFWRQFLGLFPVKCAPVSAPAAPKSGFLVYCDEADGKLKAKASSGAITVLANP